MVAKAPDKTKAIRRAAKKKTILLIRESRTLNQNLAAEEASLPLWRRVLRF
jgi:hypothetical protein